MHVVGLRRDLNVPKRGTTRRTAALAPVRKSRPVVLEREADALFHPSKPEEIIIWGHVARRGDVLGDRSVPAQLINWWIVAPSQALAEARRQ